MLAPQQEALIILAGETLGGPDSPETWETAIVQRATPPEGQRRAQTCTLNRCPGLRRVQKFGNEEQGLEFAYRSDE